MGENNLHDNLSPLTLHVYLGILANGLHRSSSSPFRQLVSNLLTFFDKSRKIRNLKKKEYYLSRDEVHKVENAITDEERAQALKHAARNIQAQNRTFGGAHRYCHINKCIKPDRSHYCSGMKN